MLVLCSSVLMLQLLLSLSVMMSTLQMRKQRHENITHLEGTGAKFGASHFDPGMLILNPFTRSRALGVREGFYAEMAIES